MLLTLNGIAPSVDPTAYVQSSAHIVGDVHIGAQSSVWFNAVIRGDGHYVRIGARTNVQDNATIHVTTARNPTLVGDDVTVGHNVVLHGCTVGSRCLIGIGAIVLDRCAIADDCLIGAGALLTPGTSVEPGQLVLGNPARVVRPITDAERQHLVQSAAGYVANAARYRNAGIV
jgi:carbonic anhydrase/acetyltransferase-like protein (isoleucine patch superfamily)